MGLHDQLLPLRESIRDAMLIWVTAGSAASECATAQIHEYPNMKKYDYLRTPLQADIRITHREDHKVLSYFFCRTIVPRECVRSWKPNSPRPGKISICQAKIGMIESKGSWMVSCRVKRQNAFDSPKI